MIVDPNYMLMEEIQRYQELASKWLNNTISEEEKKEFAAWYHDNQDENVFIESEFARSEDEYRKYLLEKILSLTSLPRKKSRKTFTNKRLWVALAAAVLCVVVIGTFFRSQKKGNKGYEIVNKNVHKKENNTTLNSDRPTITIAKGKIIVLDNLKIGDIIKEEGVVIKKIASNTVSYTADKIVTNKNDNAYHTIRTPFGKDYKLILSDGSVVWLNARSELKFPAQLGKTRRRVALNGEAYFAVNHSSQNEITPFIVESRLQEVYVLGTEFNINAYSDEKWISTTLVHGAVKVRQSQNDAMAVLKPNHQALISTKTTKIKIKQVNAAEVVSWKEGYFNFNDSDIKSVLRQFARWYGVEVVYQRNHFPDAYVGKIPKSLSLEEALSVLETVGVKFKIENRKLIII